MITPIDENSFLYEVPLFKLNKFDEAELFNMVDKSVQLVKEQLTRHAILGGYDDFDPLNGSITQATHAVRNLSWKNVSPNEVQLTAIIETLRTDNGRNLNSLLKCNVPISGKPYQEVVWVDYAEDIQDYKISGVNIVYNPRQRDDFKPRRPFRKILRSIV